MLGAAGVLAPDLLSKMGVNIEPKWWNVGKEVHQLAKCVTQINLPSIYCSCWRESLSIT